MALVGAGSLFIRTNSLAGSGSTRGQELLMPLCIAGFEMTFDTQLAEAMCLVDGKKQVTAAAVTQETATVRLTFQFADFNTLGLAYDELPSTSTAVQIPMIKFAQVPTVAPFEVADTGVDENTLVYNSTTRTFLKKASGTTVSTATEYAIDGGKIVFHASAAGNTVEYQIFRSFSSIPTIGVAATADSFGVLELWGQLYQANGERYVINIPRLSRVSTPNISITGDVAEIQVEFRASVPPGARRSFRLFNITGGVE